MDPISGGPCQGIRNLTPLLHEYGHTVEVVCLDDRDSEYLNSETIKVHALGQGQKLWRYHPKLLPWLNENIPRFDAVILNGLWLYPGYALSKATRYPEAPPYFIFPHGMLDPWFQVAAERRAKAIRNWFYWKLIEQRVVSRAAALFFTCAEEMQLARQTFRPYRPQREINVGYGIESPPRYRKEMTAAFLEKCPGLKEGQPYYLFLGRIHPKKGIDLLIKAYAAICNEANGSRPAARPPLVIAGPGMETPFGQAMQKLAANLCTPDSVFWPGMLTGDAKWGAIYDCETFVLPSHQENFGIAVAEALACGKPVLISEQINIWREIKEDGAGLVSRDTVEGTIWLLRHWNSLTSEAKTTMAHAAKSSFAKRYSVVSSARSLDQTIKELTGDRRSSHYNLHPNESIIG